MDRSNDLEFMKEYLFNAMTFEKYVYTWSNALNSVNHTILSVEQKRKKINSDMTSRRNYLTNFDNNYRELEDTWKSEKNKKTIAFFIELCLLIALIIAYLYIHARLNDSDGTLLFFFLVPVIPLFIGVLNNGIIIIKDYSTYGGNEEKEKRRQGCINALNEYESSLISVENQLSLITGKRINIEKNLNDVKSTLEEVYSQNVLPECYRNFVAVATMYQYIVTGRCVCIKGHGGIYDTYEHDFRMNLIITNLQRINEKLDEIIENQNMLYRQMVEANENLKSINKELNNISENTSKIERSSAMAALAQHQAVAIMNYNASKHW